jgi:hypothetical protein
MRFGETILEIAAALDDAAAISHEYGFGVRGSVSLPLRVRFRRDAGLDVRPETPRRIGSLPRSAARLTVKR